METIQDFIPVGRKNRPGRQMNPKYITVHDTANPEATAKNHASFLKNTDKSVSWHFTVDDVCAVQHLPINEQGYHARDGQGPGNAQSIGVEICEFADSGRRAKAEKNAVALIRDLISLTGAEVVQHFKWTGKNCPRVIRSRPHGWEDFLKLIKGGPEMKSEDAQKVADILGNVYGLLSTAGVSEQNKDEIHRLANEVRKAGGLPTT